MPKENTEITNTLPYSIWETKTKENQLSTPQESAKSVEETALESKKSDKRD